MNFIDRHLQISNVCEQGHIWERWGLEPLTFFQYYMRHLMTNIKTVLITTKRLKNILWTLTSLPKKPTYDLICIYFKGNILFQLVLETTRDNWTHFLTM